MHAVIGSIGEKRLLKEILLPLVNPATDPFLSGDDCGIVDVPAGHYVCASTDRVPWDLTAYRLGVMSERELGYYLAVLNISDIAATGAAPVGLLVNLALPSDFLVEHLVQLMSGVLEASEDYSAPVLGGDLSDSVEPSLSATAIGIGRSGGYLRRTGAEPGDLVFTTGPCGLSATAFRYFREARPSGMRLPVKVENLLRRWLTRPAPRLRIGQALASSHRKVTAMDNTDGISQVLHELADASSLHFVIAEELLPIHPATKEVASFIGTSPVELIMGPGADFNLIGTVDTPDVIDDLGLRRIGWTEEGSGVSLITAGGRRALRATGWDYFNERCK